MYYILVLGCDLNKSGDALGRRTLSRLDHALRHHYHSDDPIVVGSMRSPYHPDQKMTLGELMAENLRSRGCQVIVLPIESFDTRGEVGAFINFLRHTGEKGGIISASFHLRRVRVLIWHLFGKETLSSLYFIPCSEKVNLRNLLLLEPLKYLNLFLPKKWREVAVKFFRGTLGNSSW